MTPEPTATPAIEVRWVLTPYLNPEGTPVVQEVVFTYTVSAGDVAIILPAAVAIFLLWALIAIYLWESNRGNRR